MRSVQFLTAILLATTAVDGAYAVEQATQAETAEVQSAENAVAQDVGRLSNDGSQAFRDMRQARLAIFNADPTDAKTMIGKAQAAIEKAKEDDAVYMKAEADLDAKLNQAAAKTATARTNATDDPSKEVAWLPIDGQLALGEDFVATPEKAAAVKEANENVQKGDRKSAVETLKLADIEVSFTMAVLPLEKTAADIQQAASLIEGGKYYEANALLKGTEERMRFDAVDVAGTPVAANPATAGAKTEGADANAAAPATANDGAPDAAATPDAAAAPTK